MWFSSLTPFSSSYRPEVPSASEEALKASAATVSQAATTKAADPVSVHLSETAARILEFNKPIDVASMTAEQAKARYDQLTGMFRYGGYEHMGVTAVLGDQRTDSMETFLSWLAERGKDADPSKISMVPSQLDLKA